MKPYYDRGGITIYCGDCLEVMPRLDCVFDAILADLPYGTTACSWDTIIPFEPLWGNYKRLVKERGAVVLFGSQPFTSKLVTSNLEWFKYEDIWLKTQSVGHLNCNVMPLRQHENILVFGKGKIMFNPQVSVKPKENIRPLTGKTKNGNVYGSYGLGNFRKEKTSVSYPRSVVKVANVNGKERSGHDTQKPVALLQYLTRTYTNPGDLILDNTMGSGTTLLAAQNEGRQCVGIELSEDYCKIAVDRLRQPSFFSIPDKVEIQKHEQLSLEKRGR